MRFPSSSLQALASGGPQVQQGAIRGQLKWPSSCRHHGGDLHSWWGLGSAPEFSGAFCHWQTLPFNLEIVPFHVLASHLLRWVSGDRQRVVG